MRFLLDLKLFASVLKFQFMKKVKAGAEFKHVQSLSRNLPEAGGAPRLSTLPSPCCTEAT